MDTEKENQESSDTVYECPLLKLTFVKPCTILTCNAHVNKFERMGFRPRRGTNCLHVDFRDQYGDDLTYAVEEQGRVGYRDLDYLSEFFGTTSQQLRAVYEEQEDVFQVTIQVLASFATLEGKQFCQCGRSSCEDPCPRDDVVALLAPYLPTLTTAMSVKDVCAILWMDHDGKRSIFPATIHTALDLL